MRASCAIIENLQGQVLACRMAGHKRNAGRYEFPGGKREEGETDEECLHREIAEELGIFLEVLEAMAPVESLLPSGKTLVLVPFRCRIMPGSPSPLLTDHDELRWTAIDALQSLPWVPSDIEVLAQYLARLQG